MAFSYAIAASTTSLVLGVRRLELNTSVAVRAGVFELALLGIVLLFLRARGWKWRRAGMEPSWPEIGFGLLLFIANLTWFYCTVMIAIRIVPSLANADAFQFVVTASAAPLLFFIIVNSFFEEMIVSGYVISSMSNQGAALSITASTLIRRLYHLYQGPIAPLSILPMGLLFGWVYWRRRNLWPLITAHTMANVLGLLVFRQHS